MLQLPQSSRPKGVEKSERNRFRPRGGLPHLLSRLLFGTPRRTRRVEKTQLLRALYHVSPSAFLAVRRLDCALQEFLTLKKRDCGSRAP